MTPGLVQFCWNASTRGSASGLFSIPESSNFCAYPPPPVVETPGPPLSPLWVSDFRNRLLTTQYLLPALPLLFKTSLALLLNDTNLTVLGPRRLLPATQVGLGGHS